ncbi:MAG: LptF/LptG family permease, partial [Gemmatimonadota bacterium]|nr:LptF/LptG family permease [Gemmatimonadota bacterium]
PRSDFRRNVDYQGEDGRRWTAATFNLHRALLDEVKLLQFSGPPESPRIEYRIDADSAVFLPGGGWKFTRGTLRHFQTGSIRRGGEWAVSFENLRLPRLSEKPGDFVIEFKEAQQMSFDELEAAIRQKRRNGINTARDEVELWLKTAMPAACFIIVLFGAPLAVLRRKIGPGTGIALGVMVYILFMSNFYLTRSMGYSGTLHPAAAAWASNAIFAAVGFLIFFKVRK